MFIICRDCYNNLRTNGVSLEESQGRVGTTAKVIRCEICGDFHEAQHMHPCTGNCAPFPRYGRKVVGPSEHKGGVVITTIPPTYEPMPDGISQAPMENKAKAVE